MSSVVSMLEGKSVVEEIVSESSSEALDEKKLQVMRMLYKQTEERDNITEIQQEGTSVDELCAASSTSASDLYPFGLLLRG
ncbi:hypothetical protein K1719_034563 [Acacia pycnantha]|nr:hypothetical protein K1719_034563 [Acacia pycnantha]